jgi:hypothetical protein
MGQFAFGEAAIDGLKGLRALIVTQRENYVSTLAEKLLSYALGRALQPEDMPVVRSIIHDAARNDYRFSALVLGIVKSAPFQMKVKMGS